MSNYGPPSNNQNGVKIKDPDLRQKAFEQYCAWIAKGKVRESFTFIEGNLTCTYKTMESYIKNYPLEFPSEKLQAAYAQGYAKWESVCDGSAEGSNKKANVASLNMLMRNKFGWDRESKYIQNVDDSKLSALQRFFKSVSSSQSPESKPESNNSHSE